MTRTLRAAAGILAVLVASPLAAAPDPAVVQGIYEGEWEADPEEGRLDAQVIALGKGTYKAHVTQFVGKDRKKADAEMAGRTEGETVVFEGKSRNIEWEAVWKDGGMRGRIGPNGKCRLRRVVRESPAAGKEPPQAAVVIFDGTSFDGITKRNAKTPWKQVDGGGVQVPKGGIRSEQAFEGSFDFHVEFLCNFKPDARGQGRGNSGVYLPCGSEIQVLDSFGFKPGKGTCGALYGQKAPDVNASLPPLQWQTYDVEYRVQKDAEGRPAGKPTVTVLHNGVKIHDKVELRRPARKGQFHLQDHGNPVCYRNIWLVPVGE